MIVTEAWKAPVFKKHLTKRRINHTFDFNTAETLVFIDVDPQQIIHLSMLISMAEADATRIRVINEKFV